MAVVPTMREQSAIASATVRNSSARLSRSAAPTADCASRKATSYGFTTRRREKPKLLMALATAPILSGLRGATSTTRRQSKFAVFIDSIALFAKNEAAEKRTNLRVLPFGDDFKLFFNWPAQLRPDAKRLLFFRLFRASSSLLLFNHCLSCGKAGHRNPEW